MTGKFLHFRIVAPPGRHQAIAARGCKVYVTFPGEPERELPGVRNVDWHGPLDGPIQVDLSFIGSLVVEEGEGT